MSFNSQQTIEVRHGQSAPKHAIIWLHGLGASANDFPPVVPYLSLDPSLNLQFIFPQAPQRPITVNGGMVMPGWYDIKGMDLASKEDLPGMLDSQAILESLIKEQQDKGIPSANIILAGFSQGGAVAYYSAIRSAHKFAGVLALSTYLPFASAAAQEHKSINKTTPIMAMHGTADPVVPHSLGQQSVEVLTALDFQPEWHPYPMQHEVIPQQLVDIGKWINRVFGAHP